MSASIGRQGASGLNEGDGSYGTARCLHEALWLDTLGTLG